jgi:hypothetical protein
MALLAAEHKVFSSRRRHFMITRQLLPIFVLAIGGLALLGCGSQTQVPDNMTQASNQTLSKINSVSDAGDDAAVPASSLAGDVSSSSAQGRATQFVMPNPRQHVLSSGFPVRAY